MTRKEIDELLLKARRSVVAAERLLASSDNDFAVSRAYYAMFYAARALLLTRDVRRSKHSGVIAAFNEQFVHEGKISRQCFIWLRDAFDDRAEGDYGLAVISEEQARAGIATARAFVEEISRIIADVPKE
jgi:uncharacterized protein (UPF0332 family)